jgi:hypothetical protein
MALSGVEAVVDQAVKSAEPAPAAAQLALPGLPLAAQGEAARDPAAGGEPGKSGRPKGALNRRTEEFVEYILSRYRSPLVGLAETYSRSVADLASELGCTKLEAFQLQQAAMVNLAPYLHQKLPQAVQIDGKGLVAVSIVDPVQLARMATGEAEAGDGLVIGGKLLPPPANVEKSEG